MNVKFLWLFMVSEDDTNGKQHPCSVRFYTDIVVYVVGFFQYHLHSHTCTLYRRKNLIGCILICYGKITLREIYADIHNKILLLPNETSAYLSVHLQRQQTLRIIREMNKVQKIATFIITA